MDGFTLRCNNLRCRTQLELRAAVTTCSHIFCISCASSLQLTNPQLNGARVCPACDTTLSAPDDAVITVLNPSDDYKTSVLGGLSPTIILEICSKGLGFWTYQVTQEVVYQEYLAKSLMERSNSLSGQLDKLIRDANSEIGNLRDKVAAMSVTEEELRRKNHELMEGWREKGRKLAQTQGLYDKLKRQTLLSQVQHAASENISQTLLMSNQQNSSLNHPGHPQDPNPVRGGHVSSHSRGRHRDSDQDFILTGARIGSVHGGRTMNYGGSSGRSSPFGAGSAAIGDVNMIQSFQQQPQRLRIPSRNTEGFLQDQDTFPATPSRGREYRQRLPATPTMNTALRAGRYVGENLMTRASSQGRHPLESMDGNVQTRGIGNEIGDRSLRKDIHVLQY